MKPHALGWIDYDLKPVTTRSWWTDVPRDRWRETAHAEELRMAADKRFGGPRKVGRLELGDDR